MKKNKLFFPFLIFLFVSITANAQQTIKLWDGAPPTDNGLSGAEHVQEGMKWMSNISVPEITIYSPKDKANNGMSVIICPGGGYGGLAYNHEGIEFAQWLNTQGITGIILKYRMPNKNKKVPLEDAHQAIRYIRDHAKELKIDVNKVGIAGFSAGGHLAAMASTHYTTTGTNTRPNFSILFYPVITMEIATHGGTRANLLGDKLSTIDIHNYSTEKQVNNNTPPAIILLSDDDEAVPTINSTKYYDALKANDIAATMYIFPEGGHGWGMNKDFKYHTEMLSLLASWLKDVKI